MVMGGETRRQKASRLREQERKEQSVQNGNDSGVVGTPAQVRSLQLCAPRWMLCNVHLFLSGILIPEKFRVNFKIGCMHSLSEKNTESKYLKNHMRLRKIVARIRYIKVLKIITVSQVHNGMYG